MSSTREKIHFPSLAWFQKLADLMNANRARQEQLGYVDCVAQFTVSDGGAGGSPWNVQMTFEELSCIDVREVGGDELPHADFVIEASRATWREMIESIAAGGGRPDLEQTLNRLSHFDTPIRVWSDDVIRKDMYFRFNQSLQELVNASAAFETSF